MSCQHLTQLFITSFVTALFYFNCYITNACQHKTWNESTCVFNHTFAWISCQSIIFVIYFFIKCSLYWCAARRCIYLFYGAGKRWLETSMFVHQDRQLDVFISTSGLWAHKEYYRRCMWLLQCKDSLVVILGNNQKLFLRLISCDSIVFMNLRHLYCLHHSAGSYKWLPFYGFKIYVEQPTKWNASHWTWSAFVASIVVIFESTVIVKVKSESDVWMCLKSCHMV